MTTAELLGYLAVLVGGATPVVEALVAIPAGIVAGLAPVPAAALAIVGNVATVALAALWGERLNRWCRRRRQRRARAGAGSHRRAGAGGAGDVGSAEGAATPEAVGDDRRRGRAARLWRRYGLPGLAVLAPVVTGTQLAALAAVAAGAPRAATAWWISVGTLAWGVVAAVATTAGVDLFTG